MSNPTVTDDDLATYLGVSVDRLRASKLIQYAWDLCETIVTPLPAAGVSVVLDVVSRAYVNPTAVPGQVAGPFSQSGASGGLYLTRANKATLRRLNGGGGAFSFDPLASTAGDDQPWWDQNVSLHDGNTFFGFDDDDDESS